MKVEIAKISPANFTGSDGKPVNGTYFYYKNQYAGSVNRIFMTADAVLRMSHVPVVGDCVYLVLNGAGKVVDMLEDF